jgi:glycosyltransferase involved in cell wall biosynthesis
MSSSPTKIAEYLASGLPVITNAGIGDLDDVIAEDNVGVILDAFNRDSYVRAVKGVKDLLLDRGVAERCRESARKRFDLANVGGVRYRRLYRRVFERECLVDGSNGTGANFLE